MPRLGADRVLSDDVVAHVQLRGADRLAALADPLPDELDAEHVGTRGCGIDTPETKKPGVAVECGGREATSRMWRLTFTAPYDADGDGRLDHAGGTGRRIVLRTDPTQLRYDRLGRLLAYAKVDGRLLPERMLASGWATTYLLGWTPFRKRARFLALEATARKARRGVYGRCGGDFHSRQGGHTPRSAAS